MTDAPNPFQSLAACLGEDERLRLELHRTGATLAVLVQPVLKAAPSGLDAEWQRLRAALAYPLRLTGTAAQLDRELVAALVAYGAKRQEVRAAGFDLDALDEALRHARQAAHAQRQSVAPVGKTVAPRAAAQPTPTAAVERDAEDTGETGAGLDARPAAPLPAAAPSLSPTGHSASLF